MTIGKRLSGLSGLLLTGLMLALALTACNDDHHNGNEHASAAPLVVQTAKGKVKGIHKAAMRAFLGIPYAAPPVGDLRWKSPQPAQPWTDTRDARQFANHCPQTNSPFGQASTTEDCLYLNVFTPADKADKGTYPVMVWIHGGAMTYGESDDYNPVPLVDQGVVVVTLNYRLGMLGFLALPGLTSEAPADRDSGNYALMDQQAALRWVQRNIAAFGGDPDNVTIFGESAGGLSVLSQLLSPTAKGLFQKAIVESGSYGMQQPSLTTAENNGEAFAGKVGCAKATAKATVACLREVPVKEILAKQGGGISGFQPRADTVVLPKSIGTALKSGSFKKIPVMEGTNRNEWRLFTALLHAGSAVTAQQYKQNHTQTIRNLYPLSDFASPDLAVAAIGTDTTFACNGLLQVGWLSRHVKTYAYEFNDPNAPELFVDPAIVDYPPDPGHFPFASAHASEIQYLFKTFNVKKTVAHYVPLDKTQQKLSHQMVTYWTQFAKTGNPSPSSGSGAPFWPAFTQNGGTYLSLQPTSPTPLTDFAKEHRCSHWNQGK